MGYSGKNKFARSNHIFAFFYLKRKHTTRAFRQFSDITRYRLKKWLKSIDLLVLKWTLINELSTGWDGMLDVRLVSERPCMWY